MRARWLTTVCDARASAVGNPIALAVAAHLNVCWWAKTKTIDQK